MSEVRELMKKSGYSDEAIKFYERKVNVGDMPGPDAHFAYTGPCGDTMKIFRKIKSGVIKDAKFLAIGCAGSFASGSALTKMIMGMSLKEAKDIDETDILNYLGGMPQQKVHCARLAKKTLKKAISQYKEKNKIVRLKKNENKGGDKRV